METKRHSRLRSVFGYCIVFALVISLCLLISGLCFSFGLLGNESFEQMLDNVSLFDTIKDFLERAHVRGLSVTFDEINTFFDLHVFLSVALDVLYKLGITEAIKVIYTTLLGILKYPVMAFRLFAVLGIPNVIWLLIVNYINNIRDYRRAIFNLGLGLTPTGIILIVISNVVRESIFSEMNGAVVDTFGIAYTELNSFYYAITDNFVVPMVVTGIILIVAGAVLIALPILYKRQILQKLFNKISRRKHNET